MLRGKFIALSAFIKNLRDLNWTAHLKALEQKEANISKRSRLQEIVKLRVEINQFETKRTIKRMDKTKGYFFEKNLKIDTPLAKLNKGHRDSIQINEIRNEK